MDTFDIIIKYKQGFLDGLQVTLELAFLTWTLGILFGSILGVLSHRFKVYWGIPIRFISLLLSSIPLLVFLYWAYYPMQEILNITIDPFITAVTVFIILNSFGVADICRVALNELPNEYIVAARVCGLNKHQIVKHIQFPLIFRQILPSILNLQVNMLQMTLFASLISVEEIFRVANGINSSVHKPIEIYSALAVFFLLVCLPLNGLAYWLKYRFTRKLSHL